MLRLRSAAIVWLWPLVTAPLWAGASAGAAERSPLFREQAPLEVTLEAPWGELLRRKEAGRSVEGRLLLASPQGGETAIDARVTVRGKSRLELCAASMLTLTLNSDQIQGTLFATDAVVHLTAQCRSSAAYLQFLELEILAYRVFSLLSDAGLGSRRLEVVYAKPGKRRPAARRAFLVEDIGVAATKAGVEWQRPVATDRSALDPEASARFALFQLLIGNTDWSVRVAAPGERCCHNVALLGPPEGPLVPVPFDLDSAGLVNAPYGAPDPLLGIRSHRQRLYRGHCLFNPSLEAAIAELAAARPEVLALFQRSEWLSARSRSRAIDYLEGFFEMLADPDRVADEIVGRCRDW